MIEVKYSTSRPPNYREIQKAFKPNWDLMVFAYGDTIHTKHFMSPDLEVHEKVHLKQQGYTQEGAKEWWRKYIDDPQFRFSQEIEAYRAQYQYITKHEKDRNMVVKKRHQLARDLATYYNLNISTDGALGAIMDRRK